MPHNNKPAGEALPPSNAPTGHGQARALGLRAHGCRFHYIADRRRITMNRFSYLRRATLAVALFGIVGLVLLPAAQADPFHTSGSYVETSFNGSIAEGTLDGRAAPGGDAFIGSFSEEVFDGGNVLDGTAILDFGNGDTLTFDYLLVFNPTRQLYLGGWIVRGGTGTLKNAAGGGNLTVSPNYLPDHRFWLDGDLSQ
jgi:hypothetical protein